MLPLYTFGAPRLFQTVNSGRDQIRLYREWQSYRAGIFSLAMQ